MVVYSSTTPTNMATFAADLFSFANTNGWTIDDDATATPGALNNGTTYIQMDWNTISVAIYQSLGWLTPTNIGAEADDSGSGGFNDGVDRGLHVPVGSTGPYTSAHFFTDDNTTPTYIYAVLEYAPGLFRHMAFGEITKVGNWTGGSFAFGSYWNPSATTTDNPKSPNHTIPFEGLSTSSAGQHGTLHMEGFPDQTASGKWGVVWGGTAAGTDTAAVGRDNVYGGMRNGPLMNAFGWVASNPVNGFINLVPLPLFYRNTVSSKVTLLGFAPDIRYVNMKNLTPNTDYTVGSETWRVFPMARKQFLKNDTEESWNAGIAYRKV